MTAYLIAAVVFLGGIIAAYLRGQSTGKTQAKAETQAGELKAIKTAKGIDDATANLDEPHINAALDRWMRDKQR